MNRANSADDSKTPVFDSVVAPIVGWGLATYGATQIAASVLARSGIGAVAVQAAIAEWGAGQLSITWSDPSRPLPSAAQNARRFAIGAAWGFGACAAVTAVSLAMRSHVVGGVSRHFEPFSIFVGLIASGLTAVRDELLLRGVALRLFSTVSPWASIFACAVCAAAARAGQPDPFTIAEILTTAGSGAFFCTLWQRDRGAWLAVGANTAWTWGIGTLLRGGVIDIRDSTSGSVGASLNETFASAAILTAAAALLAGLHSRTRNS